MSRLLEPFTATPPQTWIDEEGRAPQILVDEAQLEEFATRRLEMEVGDLLIFTGQTAHRGGSSTSPKVRCSLSSACTMTSITPASWLRNPASRCAGCRSGRSSIRRWSRERLHPPILRFLRAPPSPAATPAPSPCSGVIPVVHTEISSSRNPAARRDCIQCSPSPADFKEHDPSADITLRQHIAVGVGLSMCSGAWLLQDPTEYSFPPSNLAHPP